MTLVVGTVVEVVAVAVGELAVDISGITEIVRSSVFNT